jgi:predicted transcriptional regulator
MKKYQDMNEEEKIEMWDEIAEWFSLPEDERKLKQKELYESYGIPERTFYWKLQQEDFNRDVVKKTLNRARRFTPEVIRALQKNVYEGKEKSIEMHLKYVAEQAEHVDHTTKGEKMGQSDSVLDAIAVQMEKEIKKKYENNT